jgi:2-isopropylmalate synthase
MTNTSMNSTPGAPNMTTPSAGSAEPGRSDQVATNPANAGSEGAPRSGTRLPKRVEIYDTTLRDGSQLEGISFTVEDKLTIARQLDRLGVHYIEGGWPGSNPKDDEFFRRAAEELKLENSTFVAFGSTRRPRGRIDQDQTLQNLISAGTKTVCIVGKCWDYHVTEALRVELEEGVAMVRDSVEFLVANGLEVMYDAEHVFDGYVNNPEFSMQVLEAAAVAGASRLVLCDTNGGSLPSQVRDTVGAIVDYFGGDVGIGVHLHDDTACGVANALAGVEGGAIQVQGTINGYGERTGNNLSLKMGIETIPAENMVHLTSVANQVAEIANFTPDPQQAYVGASAFAHKAGLHTSAIARRPDAYEHIDPSKVGNQARFVVSEMAGKAGIEIRAKEIGIELDPTATSEVIDILKRLEHEGYQFEVADASLELLLRGAAGWSQPYFELESFRINTQHRSGSNARAWNDVAVEMETEATVKLRVDGKRVAAIGEGNGPVDAMHEALSEAIGSLYPAFDDIKLTDYKVRVLDTSAGTEAITRVLIDMTNGTQRWTTIGVSENIVEASWQALVDGIVYGLLHAPRPE